MQAVMSVLTLGIVGLIFHTLHLRRAMRRTVADRSAVERRLNAEIRKQRLLRGVERRLQIAITADYDLAASEALR